MGALFRAPKINGITKGAAMPCVEFILIISNMGFTVWVCFPLIKTRAKALEVEVGEGVARSIAQ